MKPKKRKSISQLFAEGTAINEAAKQAAIEARRRHKEAGEPIVLWSNGKIVWVPAEKIKIPTRSKRSPQAKSRR
jgi:hypothetical protein